MPKLQLDWSDGRYSTRLLNDAQAAAAKATGVDIVYLEHEVYAAYVRDCERDAVWQAFWQAIANEQSMRRREQELLPLEAAQRNIAQLTEDLARAQRMESFYEDQCAQLLGQRHRTDHGEYTCIYPQPGCQVEALKQIAGVRPEWIEAAENLMEQPRFAERAPEGMKYQECCCGHRHLLLNAAESQLLRDAGFIVETATEAL